MRKSKRVKPDSLEKELLLKGDLNSFHTYRVVFKSSRTSKVLLVLSLIISFLKGIIQIIINK